MNNMLLRRRIMLGLASSPFSPATKTYIINTYGESAWNTVKDFFTDPATETLVAAVNSDPTVVEELCGINGGERKSLKSNSGAYIDTNYVIGVDDEIEIDFNYTKQIVSQGIFGIGTNSLTGEATQISISAATSADGGGGFILVFGSFRYKSGTFITESGYNYYNVLLNKSNIKIYCNGQFVDSDNCTPTTFSTSPFRLFGRKRVNDASWDAADKTFSAGDIKTLKIKKNGVYTMYLIPRIVNNKAGFLDLVTNTMLYNNDSNVGSSLSVITI